jgi:hypothetical protein
MVTIDRLKKNLYAALFENIAPLWYYSLDKSCVFICSRFHIFVLFFIQANFILRLLMYIMSSSEIICSAHFKIWRRFAVILPSANFIKAFKNGCSFKEQQHAVVFALCWHVVDINERIQRQLCSLV